MAWIQIDDHFDEHPKLQKVGPLAWGVWLAGLAYCNRNLTDGFIPWTKARSLASFDVVEDDGKLWGLSRSSGMTGEDIDAEWVIGLLIDAGLWEEVDNGRGRVDGYRVHDYKDWQRSKAEILELRDKRAEAGRAGGLAKAVASAKQAPEQNASKPVAKSYPQPQPHKNPKPNVVSHETTQNGGAHAPSESVSKSPPPPIYSDDFLTFWNQYPTGHGSKKLAFDAWRKLKPNAALQADMLAGLAKWNACDQWQRGFVTHAERFLKNRMWEDEPPIGAVVPQSKNANGFGPKGPDADWFANKARELERQGL